MRRHVLQIFMRQDLELEAELLLAQDRELHEDLAWLLDAVAVLERRRRAQRLVPLGRRRRARPRLSGSK